MDVAGWHSDPFGVHEERFFKGGEPTPLVRDRGIGSYSEPPTARPATSVDRPASRPAAAPVPPPPPRELLFLPVVVPGMAPPPPPAPVVTPTVRPVTALPGVEPPLAGVGDGSDPDDRLAGQMGDVMKGLHALQDRVVRYNKEGGTAKQRAELLIERDRLFAERARLRAQQKERARPSVPSAAAG